MTPMINSSSALNGVASALAPMTEHRRVAPQAGATQEARQSSKTDAPSLHSTQEPDRDTLNHAVQAVSDFIQPINSSLQFSVDEDSGKTVVKVIDTDTQKVLHQIPSKEMLELAKALDTMKGLLIKQKA